MEIEVLVAVIVLLLIVLTAPIWNLTMKSKKYTDKNIEWDNGHICLKRKSYPQMKDDFRMKVGECDGEN